MEALSYQIISMHSSKKCRSFCSDRLREQISLPVDLLLWLSSVALSSRLWVSAQSGDKNSSKNAAGWRRVIIYIFVVSPRWRFGDLFGMMWNILFLPDASLV